ncbi:MAG: hypothetical protein OXG04_02960 [Acidobacteria bacterium]|nr:hypothetical protein [Acidobacteriota bacterium]
MQSCRRVSRARVVVPTGKESFGLASALAGARRQAPLGLRVVFRAFFAGASPAILALDLDDPSIAAAEPG